MTTAYRLSSARFAAESGVGAALYGGRWNKIGTEAIYASASRSLAALEVLAHFSVVPLDFVLTEIEIPDELAILSIDEGALSAGWDGNQAFAVTQEIGERWVAENRCAVLSVPSSIVREERNFVMNPRHLKFSTIGFSAPLPFRFDVRLK